MSTPFRARVLEVVAAIPHGRLLAYGDVATLCGSPRAARAVGSTLRVAGGEVPWQRVVNDAGRISFKGDIERASIQRELLRSEGVDVDESWAIANWTTVRWDAADAPTFFTEEVGFDQPPSDWVD